MIKSKLITYGNTKMLISYMIQIYNGLLILLILKNFEQQYFVHITEIIFYHASFMKFIFILEDIILKKKQVMVYQSSHICSLCIVVIRLSCKSSTLFS